MSRRLSSYLEFGAEQKRPRVPEEPKTPQEIAEEIGVPPPGWSEEDVYDYAFAFQGDW